MESSFCDVIICMEDGEEFSVYWFVLVFVSVYFWVMFLMDMKESYEINIIIWGVEL